MSKAKAPKRGKQRLSDKDLDKVSAGSRPPPSEAEVAAADKVLSAAELERVSGAGPGAPPGMAGEILFPQKRGRK